MLSPNSRVCVQVEAAVSVAQLLHKLHPTASISVITLYNAQRTALELQLPPAVPCVSVDAMQGREVDFVLLSCVRTSAGGLGFVTNRRRVNVALSRSKHQLIVLGSLQCLSAVSQSTYCPAHMLHSAHSWLGAQRVLGRWGLGKDCFVTSDSLRVQNWRAPQSHRCVRGLCARLCECMGCVRGVYAVCELVVAAGSCFC